MALDVTGASAYVETNSRKMAAKVIATAQTAALLMASGNVQTGVKGSTPVLKIDADVVLQDGSTCGRTGAGDVRLSDVMITVKPLKDLQNYCSRTLYNTRFSWALRTGSDPEEEGWAPEFINEITDMRSAKIAAWVEKMLWQGDTTLTGSNNLKFIDGIIKQMATGGLTITGTGTTYWEKLQTSVVKMPIDVRSQDDFVIFVGQDVEAAYGMEMANRNLYKEGAVNYLHGTNYKMIAVAGLNGTNKAWYGRLGNLQLGLDGDKDIDKAKLTYDINSELWYLDFHFAIGIKVIFTDEAALVTITPDAP